MIGVVLLLGLGALVLGKRKGDPIKTAAEVTRYGDQLRGAFRPVDQTPLGPAVARPSSGNGSPCKCPEGTPMAGKTSAYSTVIDDCICGQQGWGAGAFEYLGQISVNTFNSQTGANVKGPQDR